MLAPFIKHLQMTGLTDESVYDHTITGIIMCCYGGLWCMASQVIRLVGGLDTLIRGSGSPCTWMTPVRIRVTVLKDEVTRFPHSFLHLADFILMFVYFKS